MPALLDDVAALLAPQWPDYADFLDDNRDRVAEAGELFLHRLLFSRTEDHRVRVVFEQVGREQSQLGRNLTELLGAYQVGAQAAWRHVAATALEVGVEPQILADLAEGAFVFVDQLSAATTEGYLRAQTESAAARERSRQELVQLLLAGRTDGVDVRVAAQRAGWPLPAQMLVVLADPDDEETRSALEHLHSSVLPLHRAGAVGIIVPDPGPTATARLARTLAGTGAVIGSPGPPTELSFAMATAQTALRLRRSGVLDDRPMLVDRHLDAIIAHGDERLLATLRTRELAPLDAVAQPTRERLTETLRSWLVHFGERRAVAADLHIHPQTVRYRLDQLRTLFGPALTDPDARARLFLAVVWTPE
jgi:hypothetical protein